ncbi:MAG: glutathione-regulated potassium-efflux system protein KefC [Burkholderiaceae bacterium]
MTIDLIVYLAAAVIAVPLAKRLGLGSVLGYLVAGCVIGPWGLGLVSDPESIVQVSEFGVVLMLFLIGLELDLDELWKLRGAVFIGGGAQLGATGVLLSLALVTLGLAWPAASIAGFALAMSSTAIGMQVMEERNMTATPAGRSAFAILLFQDIAAIPLIALVPLVAQLLGVGNRVEHAHPVWQNALIAVAAIASVIVGGRYLVRPVLRIVAKADVREVFTAFALLLVVGIAELMSLAGLSMALGAFIAGVVLASSEYRRALETDIAPFKGLLLGLFFISVGMSIDFGQVLARPAFLALLVAGLIAIKFAVLVAIAKPLGVARRERLAFGALLGQGGEFAFVVFSVASAAHVLDGQWVPLLTAAVAVSMAATPIVLIAADRLVASVARRERAADVIDQRAPVIIAGFGRYGQVVGRTLNAGGYPVVVLDHDPDQIELLRRFGSKVFYGDATRLDLLEAAGARDAALMVIAIDDVDDSMQLARAVTEAFPDLRILARARNVRHWLELHELGIQQVERETFESALRTGRSALESLGMRPYEARRIADRFRRSTLRTLEAMLPEFRDEQRAVARVRSGRDELEKMLTDDRVRRDAEHGAGWSGAVAEGAHVVANRSADGSSI